MQKTTTDVLRILSHFTGTKRNEKKLVAIVIIFMEKIMTKEPL